MMKKIISGILTLSMIFASAGAVFAAEESAAVKTELVNESFEEWEKDTAYTKTGTDWNGVSITSGGTMTVKEDSDGNRYLQAATVTAGKFDKLEKTIDSSGTANTVLIEFDYRNSTTRIDLYGYGLDTNGKAVGNCITANLASNGTKLQNTAKGGSLVQVGEAISQTADVWTNFKALIETHKNMIHFFINGEYWVSDAFRFEVESLTSVWIGFRDANKTTDIDNIRIVNMGTTGDFLYSPGVFDRTHIDYTAPVVSEDFGTWSDGAAYSKTGTGAQWANVMIQSGTMTVKEDSDGNTYLQADPAVSSYQQSLLATVASNGTTDSVLVSFDYRNTAGRIALYGHGLAEDGTTSVGNCITAVLSAAGTVLTNTVNGRLPDAAVQVGDNLSIAAEEWTNFKAFIVPKKNIIHFFIDGKYIGSDNFRAEAASLKQVYIAFGMPNATDSGKTDIDNIEITNMGKADDIWYNLVQEAELSFDKGTDSPFKVNGSNPATGTVTDDESFLITNYDKESGAEQYIYELDSDISGISKISLDYKMELAESSNGFLYVYACEDSANFATVSLKKDRILSYDGTESNQPVIENADLDDGSWHNLQIIIDTDRDIIRFVHDNDTVAEREYALRSDVDSLNKFFFLPTAAESTDKFYIDNVAVYSDGTTYTEPVLSTGGIAIDNSNMKITMEDTVAEGYASVEDLAGYIIVGKDDTVSVNDTDGSGDLSDNDTVTVTMADTGKIYTYSIEVKCDDETGIQAFIVYGSDGQGDNFAAIDTITKAGTGEVTLRITNTATSLITPAVIAAVYDGNGALLNCDIESKVTIEQDRNEDYVLDVTIPSDMADGRVQVMVWDSLDSMQPLMEPFTYAIDTNDFTMPTIMANNMVLQRNADVNIFGKAPEGSKVTVTLEGENYLKAGTYTVSRGYNEFFAVLEDTGAASTESKTLTVSAVDSEGNDLGTKTFSNILIGDVYYGGGQSNMVRAFSTGSTEIGQGKCADYQPAEGSEETYESLAAGYLADAEALADELNNVYYFAATVPGQYSRNELTVEQLVQGSERWRKIDASSVKSMSETLVRTAWSMQQLSDEHENVPVGLIMCALGGSAINKWVSKDTLLEHEAFAGTKESREYTTNTKSGDAYATPSDLYYDSARSVMPYSVKAAVWYQGEADNSAVYDKFVAAMVDEYQAGFHNENLPYIVVQLPGYGTTSSGLYTRTDGWPTRRLLQWNAQTLEGNIHTVVTNDTGDNTNIHPLNKNVVGDRIARTILNKVDGVNIAYMGPQYVSASYGVGSAAVTVNVPEGGTLAKYDDTKGDNLFALYDGTSWYLADDITVSGNTITVSCSSMTATPTGVRYAYGPEIVKCIYAEFADVKLPLVPFDTTYVPNTWN